jgi:hypothetical protein
MPPAQINSAQLKPSFGLKFLFIIAMGYTKNNDSLTGNILLAPRPRVSFFLGHVRSWPRSDETTKLIPFVFRPVQPTTKSTLSRRERIYLLSGSGSDIGLPTRFVFPAPGCHRLRVIKNVSAAGIDPQ